MFNKINNTNILLIALVTYFALLINPVKSEYPTTSIGVIDINMILSEAKAAKNIQEQVNASKEQELQLNLEVLVGTTFCQNKLQREKDIIED